MSPYHLNQALLARCRSTTLGCWTGIAPTTTSKTQCWPNYCTIWIQPTSMLRCPVLVQRWSTISRCWPSVAPTIVRKTPMLPVLWPVANYYWPLRPANRTTALVQCRANAISSHYEQDVGPTLSQCLQLVSFIYKYVIFPVDLSD